jgi:hypothetical protein
MRCHVFISTELSQSSRTKAPAMTTTTRITRCLDSCTATADSAGSVRAGRNTQLLTVTLGCLMWILCVYCRGSSNTRNNDDDDDNDDYYHNNNDDYHHNNNNTRANERMVGTY